MLVISLSLEFFQQQCHKLGGGVVSYHMFSLTIGSVFLGSFCCSVVAVYLVSEGHVLQ